jgi:hypothetical protein
MTSANVASTTATLTIPARLRQMRGPLTAKRAAAEIGEHWPTFYDKCKEGKRPHTRIDGKILVDPVRLAEWWEKRSV